jgi:hypothetical protein
MKANAPEKIYVVDATFPDYIDFDGSPINTKRIDDYDIEYIRTDAFIEKAAEYLMDYEFNDSPTIADRRKRVEEFKNYMKL